MKVNIERSDLLKAMSRAQGVVERRNTIPILANVLIEAEGDSVAFRATDLDIEVVDKTNAMVEQAGATTVGAHTLHEIVRKLPDGSQVQLVDDGQSDFTPAVRQGQIRHFDRGNPLLFERRLYAFR